MITLADVRACLTLTDFNPLPALLAMSPIPRGRLSDTPAREAGVLALLFPHAEGRLHILLTRRNENLRGHSGQISFPGGKHDPEDANFTATALRETSEELGLFEHIEVLGKLSRIYIPPSNFDVYPTVGYLPFMPEPRINPDEVAEVFSFALDDLLDDTFKYSEMRTIQGYEVRVPYYLVQGHKVWGATSIMLGELEARLKTVVGQVRPE